MMLRQALEQVRHETIPTSIRTHVIPHDNYRMCDRHGTVLYPVHWWQVEAELESIRGSRLFWIAADIGDETFRVVGLDPVTRDPVCVTPDGVQVVH